MTPLLHPSHMHPRKLALITGWALIAMALIAGIAMGWALPAVQMGVSPQALLQSPAHGISGWLAVALGGIALVIVLDLVVSYTLYRYFEPHHRTLSLLAGGVRIVYTCGLALAWYQLADATLDIAHGLVLFYSIWKPALVVFGVHLLLVGYLMRVHRGIPAMLWIITLVAGLSYMVVHALPLVLPQATTLASTLEQVLALPMAAGELGLAIWLLIKGGKPRQG